MRTPKEFSENLKNGILADAMMEAALFSVNEKAKDLQSKENIWELERERDKAAELWNASGRNSAALLEACKSILGDKPLYMLFPEEDCLGTFERDISDFEDISWREKYHFGKIISSHFVTPGGYEFCDYEIDTKSPEYLSYQVKLYKNAVLLMAKR